LWFRLSAIAPGTYLDGALYTQLAQEDGASFNPYKSIEQIKYVFLVKKLALLNESQRASAISELKEQGIDGVLQDKTLELARALRRRQVKLELMGRHGAAVALEEAMQVDFPIATAAEKAKLYAARAMYKTGIDPKSLLGIVRRSSSSLGR
ncbi:hypothetical protein VPH46_16290, partial [Sphingomonas sp. MJ1 (PH-R8)]|uniref:hypothetical protein n=1 Tax=Sphingomonas sp. MJ1 (PH-R8) TaxID=3112950 RepID=UPI003A8A2698